ncbi:MAG: retroviral-like aspartic protease family protein [Dehalococcoidia bacterium]
MASIVGRRFRFVPPTEDFVGEVVVAVRLENPLDRHLARRGQLPADDVRATTIDILVDTGASSLVLPQDVVEVLGIEQLDTTIVEYADGRQEERPVAGPVAVEVLGRTRNFDCVVGAPGTEPLLGQVVLEMLDFLVDCKDQRLVPRPESPNRTFYRLK